MPLKLLNVDETAPSEFYIFVSFNRLITAHNFISTKNFTSSAYEQALSNKEFRTKYLNGSARYLPFEPCINKLDCHISSPYFITAVNDYRVEYDAEVHREKHYSLYPSRLSAIYAFGDYQTCLDVANEHKNGWKTDSIKKCTLIEHELTRVVKVNMEIVSMARLAYYSVLDQNTVSNMWDMYWQGQEGRAIDLPIASVTNPRTRGECTPKPQFFEYLIEGKVVFEDAS